MIAYKQVIYLLIAVRIVVDKRLSQKMFLSIAKEFQLSSRSNDWIPDLVRARLSHILTSNGFNSLAHDKKLLTFNFKWGQLQKWIVRIIEHLINL